MGISRRGFLGLCAGVGAWAITPPWAKALASQQNEQKPSLDEIMQTESLSKFTLKVEKKYQSFFWPENRTNAQSGFEFNVEERYSRCQEYFNELDSIVSNIDELKEPLNQEHYFFGLKRFAMQAIEIFPNAETNFYFADNLDKPDCDTRVIIISEFCKKNNIPAFFKYYPNHTTLSFQIGELSFDFETMYKEWGSDPFAPEELYETAYSKEGLSERIVEPIEDTIFAQPLEEKEAKSIILGKRAEWLANNSKRVSSPEIRNQYIQSTRELAYASLKFSDRNYMPYQALGICEELEGNITEARLFYSAALKRHSGSSTLRQMLNNLD